MKAIVVTGAVGGVGKAVVKKFLKNGYFVFGLDRKGDDFTDKNYEFLSVDITDKESVLSAYSVISKKVDQLYSIINVAGVMTMGSAVECDSETMQKILDVNVSGIFRINNIFFPLIEKCKGRIINFSSEYALYTAVPFHSFYTASKHALESYNNSLRRELNYLGIKVISLRPGAIATPMTYSTAEKFNKIVDQTKRYRKTYKKLYPMLVNGVKNPVATEKIADIVFRAVTCKHPKKHYNVHQDFRVKLLSHLPEGLVDFLFKKILG